MTLTNLRTLPRFRDGVSYLYVEHAVIEREDKSVALFTEQGKASVPAASLGVLVLGPGTRITHAAMVALAECGTSVMWSGEEHARFYAGGLGKSRSSANLLRQALAWADPVRRLETVLSLYRMRFDEVLAPQLTLQQIRGREGVRVRDAYAAASRHYGVEWTGRRYDCGDWRAADPVNRALSAGAACLYGVAHAAIFASGFSPGIGFIHVGKQLSFVYDVADIYKIDLLVPAAFEAAATGPHGVEAAVRTLLRGRIQKSDLLARMARDLGKLFADVDDEALAGLEDADEALARIWDPAGTLAGGENHAGDDA